MHNQRPNNVAYCYCASSLGSLILSCKVEKLAIPVLVKSMSGLVSKHQEQTVKDAILSTILTKSIN